MSRGLQKLLRIGRNTADLERAVAFYCEALGFRVDAVQAVPTWTLLPDLCDAPSRSVVLTLGAQTLMLTEFSDSAPYPAHSAANDAWFQHCAIVVNDMGAAYDRVMRLGAAAITQGGPQTLPLSAGSVTAFKFRDPDGHPLELIAFPGGTGDPAWRSVRTGGPALGLDHSAISVADVERSILFYELLGLNVATRTLNRGIEQQRLDHLDEVEVAVIAMRAATRTPHLELLGYRQPRGCTHPAAALTAIAADRLVWQATDIDVLLDALTEAGFAEAIVASGFMGGATVALLRDPDGHLIVLNDSPS